MIKKMHFLLTFLIVIFCTLNYFPTETLAEETSTIQKSDNVVVVSNPKTPETKMQIVFTEELSIGEVEGDENYMFGQNIFFNTDEDGNFYVSDFDAHRIQKYDPDGKYLLTIGREGQGPGEFGILSSMELGFGTNIKIIRENYDGLKSTGIAFDFGILARASSEKLVFPDKQDNDIRPYFSPSVGLSWNNIGPDMEIAGNTIPITAYGRLGFAGPIGMEKKIKTGYMVLFKFTPSLELFVEGIDSFQPRYGGELSIIEALDLRLGHISTPWHIGLNTWGLGLKSQGIVKLFSDLLSPDTVERHDPVTQFLRAKLQIEFDYAHQNIDDNSFFQFEDDYYGISLSL